MKKQSLNLSPSTAGLQGTIQGQKEQLEQKDNQIHILQTTVAEQAAQLSTSKIALERRDRMLAEQIERAEKFDKALSQVRIELAGIKEKWYYSLFKNW